jgi:SHS2 domain-containing protein
MFRFFDHTGDIGVDLAADSVDDLFVEAANAFVDTVTEPAGVRTADSLRIELTAPAPDLLLHDWLNELLYRFETTGFLANAARVTIGGEAGEWLLRADLLGETAAAARLPIKVLVKAVTYHALAVEQTERGWRARVIFDI